MFRVCQSFHRLVDFIGQVGLGLSLFFWHHCLCFASRLVVVEPVETQVVFFRLLPVSKFVVQFGCECSGVFLLASSPAFWGGCLTPRAADLGYAPRYFGICLAWSFSRFDGESTLPPQAANANRWAVILIISGEMNV